MNLPPPSPLRLTATLAIAGMLSGTVLAAVKVVSSPQIEKNRQEFLARAILQVVPGAGHFKPLLKSDQGRLEEAKESQNDGIYATYSQTGDFLGYAISASGPGFADTLGLLYGLDPTRKRVIGLRVLESRETPGLGDKIMTDPDFVGSFKSLQIEPHIVAKTKGPRAEANEVDCISGATISSKAVIQIIQKSADTWLPLTQENPLPFESPAHSEESQ